MSGRDAEPAAALEERIARRFADRGLLRRALTHPSHGDGRGKSGNYERLEFLGDRVLNLMAAQYLYHAFPEAPEGGLAPRLNQLVRRETCAAAARRADLGAALIMAPSEAKLGGREKESILADACEALIGALYLEGGMEAAGAFFDRFWADEMQAVQTRPQDAKTRLQEWSLARGEGTPDYTLLDQSGPDHRPVFRIEARLGDVAASAEGETKQAAERAAADALYAELTK